MEDKQNNEEDENRFEHQSNTIKQLPTNSSGITSEKNFAIEAIEDIPIKYEEEDIDIQIVNELALTEDDRTLPCYTLRAFVTGVVSIITKLIVSD